MSSPLLKERFESAMGTYLAGEWAEASTAFQAITQEWPTCLEAWFQRADIAEHQQDWSQAISFYEKVLEQQNDIQEVWFRLGRIAVQQNALAIAENYWQQALRINPFYADPHLHLGLFYARNNNILKARQHLRSAANLDPDQINLTQLSEQMYRQKQDAVAKLIKQIIQSVTYQGNEPLELSILLNPESHASWPLLKKHLATLPSRLWKLSIFLSELTPEQLNLSKKEPLKATLLRLPVTKNQQIMMLHQQSPHVLLHFDSFQKLESLLPDTLILNLNSKAQIQNVSLQALRSPLENALHLHRWAVSLRHLFLQQQRTQ